MTTAPHEIHCHSTVRDHAVQYAGAPPQTHAFIRVRLGFGLGLQLVAPLAQRDEIALVLVRELGCVFLAAPAFRPKIKEPNVDRSIRVVLGSWLQGSWLDFDVEFFFAVLALVFQIADQRLVADREQLAPALRAAVPTVLNHWQLLVFYYTLFFGFVETVWAFSMRLFIIYTWVSRKR